MELLDRVKGLKPIPGPSPLISMMRDDLNASGFACEANNECFSLLTDSEPAATLPENFRLAKNSSGRVDHEWLYEMFNSR